LNSKEGKHMGWKVYVPPLKPCSHLLISSRNTASTAAGAPNASLPRALKYGFRYGFFEETSSQLERGVPQGDTPLFLHPPHKLIIF
ncbi:hypothetical protein BK138_35680, partial [Paenibacillus rhizosphaerae]